MIDAHCHLNDEKFGNEAENEIKKSQEAGISAVICNGFDLPSSKKAIYLAEKYDSVWATVGLGYDPTSNLEELKPQFLELLSHPKVVAVGECGLDKWEKISPQTWQGQLDLFDFHIKLAQETSLPLVVHCRNALDEVYDRLSKGLAVQMHCWTGNSDWANKFLDLGCYLSFGGIITFKNSGEIREVASQIPDDKFILETDSPYLSPEPIRNERNSPANLIHIAKVVAQARDISIDEVDQLSTSNTLSLFPKLKLPNLT